MTEAKGDLLPCPFCGGDAVLNCIGDTENGAEWWVEHFRCGSNVGIETDFMKSPDEAIEAWNTRAAVEFDNWFYLPKPKEPIVEVTETTHAWDGTKVKTDVFYQIQEQAIVAWARELDEHITKRICEVWNPERTCENVDDEFPYFKCSECGCNAVVGYGSSGDGLPNYCPNCGAKVVE